VPFVQYGVDMHFMMYYSNNKKEELKNERDLYKNS
jgi:hypothetical protein